MRLSIIYTYKRDNTWVCVCVRSVSLFFVRHTSLQNNVNGGMEPWSLVTKGRTLKENPEKTMVTKWKTLVTNGKTLVTKGKNKRMND